MKKTLTPKVKFVPNVVYISPPNNPSITFETAVQSWIKPNYPYDTRYKRLQTIEEVEDILVDGDGNIIYFENTSQPIQVIL